MGLYPSRLRRGEWIVVSCGVLLAAFMFLLKWYGPSGALSPTASTLGVTSVDGWNGLTNLRWLILLTILFSLALGLLQAGRRSPAWPSTISMFTMLLGGVTALALIYRVLIDPPGAGDLVSEKAGAYLATVAAIGIACGGYISLRQEGIAEKDAVAIEDITLPPPGP
jgi:hypothetical protein